MTTSATSLSRAAVIGQDMMFHQTDRAVRQSEADQVLRRPVSSTRRLDVISLTGGAGCSHVAARLAVLLARRRGTRVLGVDAGNSNSLSRLAQAVAAQSGQDPDDAATPLQHRLHTLAQVNTLDLAGAGILIGTAGLRVMRPAGATVRPSDWSAAVMPVARHFDVIITDWGHRRPGIDFELALAGSQAVVLVSRADRFAVEQVVSVARAVSARFGCTVCAVDVDGTGPAAARAATRWTPTPVWYMPFLVEPAVAVPPRLARECVIGLGAYAMSMATAAETGAS